MLNDAVGTVDQGASHASIRTYAGAVGHALYGPYVDLPAGAYRVTFEIAVAEPIAFEADFICATADVVLDFGKRDVVFAEILYSDVVAGNPITLDFDLAEACAGCEFRVRVNGTVPLVIADVTQLEKRTGQAVAGFRAGRLGPKATSVIKRCWEAGTRLSIQDDTLSLPLDQFAKFRSELLEVFRDDLFATNDRRKMAETVVEGVGYKGCGENSLFRAFVGTEQPLISDPGRIPFTSSLCHQTHFGYEQYRFWTKALKEAPKYQRKQWEFVFIAQVLYERGYLVPDKKGLVFGAGEEQLPALFASFGVEVVATDQPADAASASGWASTKEYTYDISALNQNGICTDRMFRELVSYRPVDMNALPDDLDGQFDFCWSACAFEHLGSLEKGLSFVRNAMRTLRPGGLAVHTTEFNLSSNEDTIETEGLSIYRRRDIERLIASLGELGYVVAPIDWSLLGEGFAEMVIDLNPYLARGEPHIRLLIGQYDCTSIGLIIEKPLDWRSH